MTHNQPWVQLFPRLAGYNRRNVGSEYRDRALAHRILDRAKKGSFEVGPEQIKWALKMTGDAL